LTLTLTLDRVIRHTIRSSLIDHYLHTKFHRNRKNFLWMDGRCMDIPTDGHFRPPIMLLGGLGGVGLKAVRV